MVDSVASKWAAIPLLLGSSLLLARWWLRTRGDPVGRPRSEKPAMHLEEARAPMTKAEKRAQKAVRKEAREKRGRAAAEERLAEIMDRLAAQERTESGSLERKRHILASVDVEAFEHNAGLITEIGLAFFITGSRPGSFRHRHVIVEEHLALRNGKYVEDNRDRFLYGDSEVLPLAQAADEIAAELNAADYIVGHAISNDLKWLRAIGVADVPSSSQGGKEKGTLEERVVDTQMLAIGCRARAARKSGKNDSRPAGHRSLKALATEYNLDPAALHNGANDAAFTLQVMLSQCCVPFDPPSRTSSTHLAQPAFREKQAIATAVAGVVNNLVASIEDAERPSELRALFREVAQFARSLEQGAGTGAIAIDTLVGVPELRFPPTLSAAERKCVHEAAALHSLSSCSQGAGEARYISVRAGGASFPKSTPHKVGRKRPGKPIDDARGGKRGD